MGFEAELEVLRRLGLDPEMLDSGCCGLAGSLEREREREATVLVADGFSCKTQIEQLGDRRPLHLAQVIRGARWLRPPAHRVGQALVV